MGKSRNSCKGIRQGKIISQKRKSEVKKRVNKAERLNKKQEIDEDADKFTGNHGRIGSYHTELGTAKNPDNWANKKK